MSYMQEPSYYTNQPTAYSEHERSAYQPWNQHPMNYIYQHMPVQAMYVPSQVPVSQMPMYNQFPPAGNEPTVTMSMYTYVAREASTYCPVPLASKVPPKPMYGTQLPQYDFAKLIRMLKDPRYRTKSEDFLEVFAPYPCKPEDHSVYNKLGYNLTENPRWEVPPEEENHNTGEMAMNFMHQYIMTSLLTTCLRRATTTMQAFQRTTMCPTTKWTCLTKNCTTNLTMKSDQKKKCFLIPKNHQRCPLDSPRNIQDTVPITISAG